MNIEFLHKYRAYKQFYENVARLTIVHKECCMEKCGDCEAMSWSSDLAHELSKVDIEWFKHTGSDNEK